jgi:D-alanine-D-alanine ligase
MRVGLTYDLRDEYLAAGYDEEETAEFDRADTIDALETALSRLGHTPDRIGNARQLIQRLSSGDRWDLVLNIAEGLYGMAREAQVPAILDVYGIPYTFSDPLVLSVCLHKWMTKMIVRAAGVPTPDFALVERPEDARNVCLPLPVFVKPVAEGTGKGIGPMSKVTDQVDLAPACRALLERYRQPVLVESFLPGRELTVGIIGTGPTAQVLGTLEILLGPNAEPEVYSYNNKEFCEELCEYRLARPENDDQVRRAEAVALQAWQVLGCRDAGRIDLRSDAHGQPQFLEANPLAGLHPNHSDLPMLCDRLGIAYETLIDRIVCSAMARQPANRFSPAAQIAAATCPTAGQPCAS